MSPSPFEPPFGEAPDDETTAKKIAPLKPAGGRCLCGKVRFEIDFPAFWAGTTTLRRRGVPWRRLYDYVGV